MIKRIKQKMRDKGGGLTVPVLFPLIALMIAIFFFFAFHSMGKELMSIFPWHIIKTIAFAIVLILASISDLKTMEVSNGYTYALLGIGLIGATIDSLIGGAICFGIFFLVALLTNLGGADVKIAGACGFILGTFHSLIALFIGLTISIIVELVVALWQKKGWKKRYPLIPYITVGCIATIIMKGFQIL